MVYAIVISVICGHTVGMVYAIWEVVFNHDVFILDFLPLFIYNRNVSPWNKAMCNMNSVQEDVIPGG
jgi:hypothetical protein